MCFRIIAEIYYEGQRDIRERLPWNSSLPLCGGLPPKSHAWFTLYNVKDRDWPTALANIRREAPVHQITGRSHSKLRDCEL